MTSSMRQFGLLCCSICHSGVSGGPFTLSCALGHPEGPGIGGGQGRAHTGLLFPLPYSCCYVKDSVGGKGGGLYDTRVAEVTGIRNT